MRGLTGVEKAVAITAVAAAALVGSYAIGTGRAHGSTIVTAPASSSSSDSGNGVPADTGVTVTGSGTATGTPDQLEVDFTVQTHSGSVSTALDDADTTVNKVDSALRSHGVASADLQTSGLSIQPSYQYTNSSQVPNGYDVSESISAKLKDIGKAGDAISAAVAAGGNSVQINGVNLDLDSTSGLLATARGNALADAKAKAQQYAKAAGRSLGPVVKVEENSAPQQPGPVYSGAAKAPMSSAAPVPISPGSQQLQVTVTVVYAWS